MHIKTYRAKSMQDAIALIRRDLGPDAAVLHTREVRDGLWSWLGAGRRLEVTASNSVPVPSRLERDHRSGDAVREAAATPHEEPSDRDWRALRNQLRHELTIDDAGPSLVESLSQPSRESPATAAWPPHTGTRDPRRSGAPTAVGALYEQLVAAEVEPEFASRLIERLSWRGEHPDEAELRGQVLRLLEAEICIGGPIVIEPGRRRVAALVGPTGVGKTTTIAKLAANFHLRERRRVGLLTVDTYRVAAVEQLRTYADIIDLPLEVAASPRELRQALARLEGLDLVLVDTAGRSPHDAARIAELQALLAEAEPDETHLVLSAAAGAGPLARVSEAFAAVGPTSLILTKLDETQGLGNLLPLLRKTPAPLSYVTHGQRVPDDIEPAQRRRLAQAMLASGITLS